MQLSYSLIEEHFRENGRWVPLIFPWLVYEEAYAINIKQPKVFQNYLACVAGGIVFAARRERQSDVKLFPPLSPHGFAAPLTLFALTIPQATKSYSLIPRVAKVYNFVARGS